MIRHRFVPRLFSKSIQRLSQCRTLYKGRRSYHDPTLVWAKENPQIAQRCLQPPGWDLQNCDPNFLETKTESLESYCRWRKWSHSSPSSELHERAIALSSHVLSAPLTLAKFYISCGFSKEKRRYARWCCVGARAEATLPYDYWKEFLLLCSAMDEESPIQISVDFVGPDIQSKTPNRTVSLEDDSSLELRWHYAGLLHETKDQWDAYIFLNPGLGHPNLQKGWQRTLERVIEEKRPILFTAHSKADAERDSKCLVGYGLEDVHYSVNPFASQITYQDPFDKNHIVRPNHYFASVFF